MEKSRKILALTGIRSEYDLQYSIAKSLCQYENVDFRFLVFGAHLSNIFGKTVENILNDNFNIYETVETNPNDDSYGGKVKTISILLNTLSEILKNYKPDLILVAGDREEVITGALAATYFNIPICHIFGGDKTFPEKIGDVDEQIRNATSKLANLHFVIHDDHKQRLLKMGEEPWRVFNEGSPALDKYNNYFDLQFDSIVNHFGFQIKEKEYAVLIHHTLPNNIEESLTEFNNILNTLKSNKIKTFISYPNNDPGNSKLIECIQKYAFENNNFHIYKNLPRDIFIPLIMNSKFLIGNSSMGILECPFLELPAINVGKRQQGRLNAGNVIFCDSKIENIQNAIDKIFYDNDFKIIIKNNKYFYGNGKSGQKIARILVDFPLNSKLLAKQITY